MLVIVMGVSGSGKSTVGAALARELGCRFIEGDDFHPPQNRAKMAAGTPLRDEDRWPWLAAVRAEIERTLRDTECAVLACSALKRSYREVLRDGLPGGSCVVFLFGSAELLAARLQRRTGHYFPTDLLSSQMQTLEPPTAEDAVLALDVARPAEEIATSAAAWIRSGAASR